jgi:hypothetical protein
LAISLLAPRGRETAIQLSPDPRPRGNEDRQRDEEAAIYLANDDPSYFPAQN